MPKSDACQTRGRITLGVLPLSAPIFLPHTPAERIWRNIFTANGLPVPSGRLCAGSPLMTQALALQSGLLALASRGDVLRDGHGGALRTVPVQLPDTTRRIGIATRAATVPSPDLQAFIDCCRKAAPAPP